MALALHCRAAGRSQVPGLTSTEGSASTALLNRDDVSVGPSEDEESALLPGHSQSRRTTNGSLDSIFERMEAQPVSHRLQLAIAFAVVRTGSGSQFPSFITGCGRANVLNDTTARCISHKRLLTCCNTLLSAVPAGNGIRLTVALRAT